MPQTTKPEHNSSDDYIPPKGEYCLKCGKDTHHDNQFYCNDCIIPAGLSESATERIGFNY